MRRTCILAIDDLVEVFRVFDVGWLQGIKFFAMKNLVSISFKLC